jgi:hypothetical protein
VGFLQNFLIKKSTEVRFQTAGPPEMLSLKDCDVLIFTIMLSNLRCDRHVSELSLPLKVIDNPRVESRQNNVDLVLKLYAKIAFLSSTTFM